MLTESSCTICGNKRKTHCSKCKTIVCTYCHKPTNQVYCELCLGKLPEHKSDCENKIKISYMKFSRIPLLYPGVKHEIDK